MKLNSKNIFARYYNWIYGELPNDVCSFFWGSLFIVLAFPFVVPGRLLHSEHETGGVSCAAAGGVVYLWYFLCVGLGLEIYSRYLGVDKEVYDQFVLSLSGLQFFVFMPILGAMLCVIAIGAMYLIITGLFKLMTSKVKKPIVLQNTSDFIGAIRRKHCTKIDWE